MKKIGLLLVLMLLLTLGVVSAGSLSYTTNNEPLSAQARGFAVTQSHIYYTATNGCVYRMLQTNFTSDSLITCTATSNFGQIAWTDQDNAYTDIVLVKRQASTGSDIDCRSTGSWSNDCAETNITGEIPLSSNMTYIVDMDDLDGDELFILGDDNRIYKFAIQDEGTPTSAWIEYFYLYNVALDDVGQNYTSVSLEADDNYLYLLDTTNSTIFVFDHIGGYIDQATISSLTTPTYFFKYDGNFWIQDENTNTIYEYTFTLNATTNDTFTLGGDTYSYSLCIDDSYLCDDVTYYIDLSGDPVFYCPNVNDTEFCSAGCSNEETDGVITGECSQFGCTNTCNIEGKATCQTATTYTLCGNYDADACLEQGVVLNCPANQFCVDDPVNGAGCEAVNITGLWSQDFITVDIDISEHTGTLDSEGYTSVGTSGEQLGLSESKNHKWLSDLGEIFLPTYTLITEGVFGFVDLIATKGFKTQLDEVQVTYIADGHLTGGAEAGYYAYTCDYRETTIMQDDLSHQDINLYWTYTNGSIDSTTIDGTLYYYFKTSDTATKQLPNVQNQRIETIFAPNDTTVNNSYTITLFNEVNTTLLNYVIDYDATTYTLTINETVNGQQIVDTTSTSNDIVSIYLNTEVHTNIQSATLHVSIERDVLGQTVNEQYYSLPLALPSQLHPTALQYDASNGTELHIYQVSSVAVEDYPVFQAETIDNNFNNCNYDYVGCKEVRVYANEYGIPTYHFYDKQRACVNQLGNLVSEDEVEGLDYLAGQSILEQALGKTWNSRQKLLVAVIVTVLIMAFFIVIAYQMHEPSMLIIGAVLGGIMLVFFTVEGYIPTWVVVLFAIIGSALAGVWLRNLIIGRQSGG